MEGITGIVLTEGKNDGLGELLSGLFFCREIIIVSDGMGKDNFAISSVFKKAGKSPKQVFKLYSRRSGGDFSAQRNFALSKAGCKWVLFADDDERIGKELAEEIMENVLNPEGKKGFYFRRRDYLLNRWLEYGETSKVRLLRLAKRDCGIWKGKVHEVWEISGKKGTMINSIDHYPHKNISGFSGKINRYTQIAAEEKIDGGKTVTILSVMFFPAAKFLFNYFFNSGYRDGIPGFIHAVMMSMHSFLVRAKVYSSQNKIKQ